MQKIYLFGAEGTTQDRGRPRPASAAASSPAKRVKTSSHQEDAAGEHQPGPGEEEKEEEGEPHQQAERDSADVEMAEKDPPSTSKHSTGFAMPFTQLLTETGRYCCAETRQGLYWYATIRDNTATRMLHATQT